jgi:hypothetical protein
MVITQEPAQPLATSNRSRATNIRILWEQQDVALSLVIPQDIADRLIADLVPKISQRPRNPDITPPMMDWFVHTFLWQSDTANREDISVAMPERVERINDRSLLVTDYPHFPEIDTKRTPCRRQTPAP